MSRANQRDAKARRRAERIQDPGNLVQVQQLDELAGHAERGETLSCGCDAHGLLHMLTSGGPLIEESEGLAEILGEV